MAKRAYMVFLLAAACGLAGCRSLGLRNAASESEKQAAAMANTIATRADAGGMMPGSRAAETLKESTLANLIATGLPEKPVDVAPLFPPGEADAWSILSAQKTALKTRSEVLMRAMGQQTDRLADFAEWMTAQAIAGKPLDPNLVIDRLGNLTDSVSSSISTASAIPVPNDPMVSAIDAALREECAADAQRISRQAQSVAAIKPTIADVTGKVIDEANWWTSELAPLLALIPGGAAAAGWIKQAQKTKDAYLRRDQATAVANANATQVVEANRSFDQVVQQLRAIMQSPIGQSGVEIAGQQVTMADAIKDYLRGQDAQTRDLVSQKLASIEESVEGGVSVEAIQQMVSQAVQTALKSTAPA